MKSGETNILNLLDDIKPSGALYSNSIDVHREIYLAAYDYYLKIVEAVHTAYYVNRIKRLINIKQTIDFNQKQNLKNDLTAIIENLFIEIELHKTIFKNNNRVERAKVYLFENVNDAKKYTRKTKESVIALVENEIKNDILTCFTEIELHIETAENWQIIGNKQKKMDSDVEIAGYENMDEFLFNWMQIYRSYTERNKIESFREALGLNLKASSQRSVYNNYRTYLGKIDFIESIAASDYNRLIDKYRTKPIRKNQKTSIR